MRTSRLRDDHGQIFPMLAVVIGVLIVGTFWLAETGIAGGLRAGGQSAADAAALAAASEVRHQAEQVLREGHPGGIDLAVADAPAAQAAASEYAGRNDATVNQNQFAIREARVEVETNRQMGSRAADDIGVSGTPAEASARARFRIDWQAPRPTPRNRHHALTLIEIESIFLHSVGIPYVPGVTRTALEYTGGCQPGPDVRNLRTRMHYAIVRLEYHPLWGIGGGPLRLSDGYRHPSCGGPVGFGQGLELYSPENYGDAIRVGPAQRGAVVARQSHAGLCRPYPATDPGLFAHRSSLICDGRTGDLSPTQVFGGDLDSIVDFEVELIPDEGSLGSSQP